MLNYKDFLSYNVDRDKERETQRERERERQRQREGSETSKSSLVDLYYEHYTPRKIALFCNPSIWKVS